MPVRVVLPAHLSTLAQVGGEVLVEVKAPVSVRAVLDAIDATYPVLQGTIREHGTLTRRPFLRFFVCETEVSLESPDTLLPDAVASGQEPFYVIGAIAGGEPAVVALAECIQSTVR